MSTDEKDSKPLGKGVEIVPTEVRDFDFSRQANRPAPGDHARKKSAAQPEPASSGWADPRGRGPQSRRRRVNGSFQP